MVAGDKGARLRGKPDYSVVCADTIRSLSHKELSHDGRVQAAAQISAALLESASSDERATTLIPCVVKDGYVRSLAEVLQHVLCSADCAASARTDRRLWALLARVLESKNLDGDSLNKKLTIAARLGILHWTSEGDAEAVDGLAENLLSVFETIHSRFTLQHFDRVEKWVELLQACISSATEFRRGYHLKRLVGFLAKECACLQTEEKPWFMPTLTKLLIPALECIHANSGESVEVDGLKSFLSSVLFNPQSFDDFRKFAIGQMREGNPLGTNLGGSKSDKSNARVLFEKLQSGIQDSGTSALCILEGLPWMLDHLCRQLGENAMESDDQSTPNLKFSLFTAFLAVALPLSSGSGSNSIGKKRKASQPDAWAQSISGIEGLLSVAIKTRAYRPTDRSAAQQILVLQTVLDTVMAGAGPSLTSKRQKTGKGPVQDGVVDATSGVVKKLLKMEHRVIHAHLEQILDLAFMEFPESNARSECKQPAAEDMLGLLVRAYSEVRQLDVLLDSVLTRLRQGNVMGGRKEGACFALPRGTLGILSKCVWDAPPMQTPDLLKRVLSHFAQCNADMSEGSIICVGEIVVATLDRVKVTLSEAPPTAAVIQESLNGDVAKCPAAQALEGFVQQKDGIQRPVLALVMLKVRSSCDRLYRSCALLDPAIDSLWLERSATHEGKIHCSSSETMYGSSDRDLIAIVGEVNKQCSGQGAGEAWGYEQAWRRITLECLLRNLHAKSLLWTKGKYLSHRGLPSNATISDVDPNGSDTWLIECLQDLTNAIFDCIPVEKYDRICGDIAESSASEFFVCHESEVVAVSWVDLCYSFQLWSTHASKNQLVGMLKNVIWVGSHSLGKCELEWNAVENATWRLLSDPDTFVSDVVIEGLMQALGRLVWSLLSSLNGSAQPQATLDPDNPAQLNEIFKKLSNKSTISACRKYLNSSNGLDRSNCSVNGDGNGIRGSQEDGLGRLTRIFQLASRFPYERMGMSSKLGSSIGLGAAAVLAKEHLNFQNCAWVECFDGLLRWLALVCAKKSLKKPQFDFLMALTGTALSRGSNHSNLPVGNILKSLGSLGLANCNELNEESLERIKDECVRCAVQVGVIKGKSLHLKGDRDEAFRKSIRKSMKPMEKHCVADFERLVLFQSKGLHQCTVGGCTVPQVSALWCFGSICHSLAAFIRTHQATSKQSNSSSKLPLSIAKIHELMGSILDSVPSASLSTMPTFSVVGLVDLMSAIGGCLAALDPVPSSDAWFGVARFHACILMSMPMPLPVDPTLQSSSLTNSNPTVVVDVLNSELAELRQAISQSVINLAHSITRCDWTLYDSMIRNILQALRDSKNHHELYAWSQILCAGLSVGHPRSKLRRKCMDVIVNKMASRTTVSGHEFQDNGLRSSTLCCLLRAIVALSRSVDRHDARPFVLCASRIGMLLFGWPEIRADSVCGPGIFFECCCILNVLASKETTNVIHLSLASVMSSFRSLLHTLVGWLEIGVNMSILVKCAESIGTAATRLAKARGKLDSFRLDLVLEFAEAISNIKRIGVVQGQDGVAAILIGTAEDVYSATNRLKRKSLFARVGSDEARFVLDGLKTEDSKRRKVRI